MRRFRLFAGPNGSGKSTLINEIAANFSVGYFINADVIEKLLREQTSLNCADYVPVTVEQADWDYFVDNLVSPARATATLSHNSIRISENKLTTDNGLDSYAAAVIAEFFRSVLVQRNSSFSFESVMSHGSKLDFLARAKDNGFKTYLYFISTRDPAINISRVQNRVRKGGHNVDEEKIVKRYYRSMELLATAFKIADRAFVIDSSEEQQRQVFVEKKPGKAEILADKIPAWIDEYLISKL